MAGIKRPRELEDIGDRVHKMPPFATTGADLNDDPTRQSQGETDSAAADQIQPSASSKLRPPSSRSTRAPLSTNTLNSNVTTRKKRSTSVPPKEIRPPPSGIVKGQRTVDADALNKSGKRVPKSTEDDPRWQRFEAQRNAGSGVHGSNRGRIGAEMQEERAKVNSLQTAQLNLETELRETKSQELLHRRGLLAATNELAELKKIHDRKVRELENEKRQMERELRDAKEDFRLVQNDLLMEREAASALKATLAQQSSIQLTLQAQLDASQRLASSLQQEVERRLGGASELQLQLEMLQKRNQFLEEEAHINEQIRRKLHNQIQELKGNIRVFVRVRPVVKGEKDEDSGQAPIEYPDERDHQQIVLKSFSESAMGNQRTEVTSFAFDRVFEPHTTQIEVFDEVSQLVQSVIDGYNVTIFAYGQTGSGKSFTMEGGLTEATEGMIPRAVRQLFQTGNGMKSKGWEYTMDGQFLEIYNETINDLLGNGEFDTRKHDIKHDKSGRTTVSDTVTLPLRGPEQVATLLARAQSRRSVAATLMNQRSSRSHSVFTLRVSGSNTVTGETCEGCLNLVDLAGSERLSSSGAANDKDRLKETQAINKSLSALGDVIAALGVAGESASKAIHIPYRNSKLTYLLQNSLGGNSKTLMILNLSPMAAHLSESLCSLRFATKVNNTTIGKPTAKKLAAAV
ncbi:kinesin-like nuclear fusion protein [Serendipita sp. 398]|nr:kinesin-like nuclear fusion protein [Serendipita sp. 398]